MAFGIILSIIMSAGILDVAASASLAGKAAFTQHLRTKRCSCASFMDKECVYFCHLDIIWVNTPERTVSYGLGNSPRLKRSVPEDIVTSSRCRCADGQDTTCSTFCQPNSALRYQPDWTEENPAVQGHGKHKTEKPRLRKPEPVSDVKSKVSTRMRVLLEKWRTSGRHRL